ncbi:hypothetical protein [Nonlabens ponticola]|uniref:DUF2975 domain-containing protein n=1 Tax=Nonlabens ponticola TaxID=2496866 RepID=A0A3S9MVK6_9FLAO|nr:hypothetical protein [Nonlabens ponticola]AZQ43255.1 hypothetical protein EJ995_03020 [Nonlabens ponticola]
MTLTPHTVFPIAIALLICVQIARAIGAKRSLKNSKGSLIKANYHNQLLIFETAFGIGSALLIYQAIGTEISQSSSTINYLGLFGVFVGSLGYLIRLYQMKQQQKSMVRIPQSYLDSRIATSGRMLFLIWILPMIPVAGMVLDYYYNVDSTSIIGYDVTVVSAFSIIVAILMWCMIYLCAAFAAQNLYNMCQHMIDGDLYGVKPIMHLKMAGRFLFVTAILLFIYSIVEHRLLDNTANLFIYKPLFYIAYFLAFVSIILSYLSKVLIKASILKKENDLTI